MQSKPLHKLFSLLQYLLVALLALFVYLNTLGHGFVFDDNGFIVKNTFIQNSRILDIFSYEFLRHSWEDLDVNRPLMVISLMFDFSIWHLNPMGYHLTNLILHAANTIIFLYLLKSIFSNSRIPILAVLLFAVHPVHIQAVNAINFREDLLVTFFYMLSLACFIRGVDSNNSMWRFFLSFWFYLLALLSKEMAITLPLICFIYLTAWKQARRQWWVFAGYILVTAVYLLFFLYIKQFSGGSVITDLTLLQRIYGLLTAFGRYLWLHLFPIGLTADYDPRLFYTFTADNIASAVITLVLFIWSLYRAIIKPSPAFFFLALFYITLIPVTNMIPILNPVAERYLYLPSIGLITIAAMGINYLMDKRGRTVVMIVLAALIMFFSILIIIENRVWKDEYFLWSDTLKKVPTNATAHSKIGAIYARENQYDKAFTEHQAALKYSPDNLFFRAAIHNSLGMLYMKNGQYPKAYEEFQAAIKLSPQYYEALINLGTLYVKELQYDKALAEYQAALSLKPDSDEIYHKLGLLYTKLKQHDRAYSAYQKALELNPGNSNIYFDLGMLLFEDSNIDSAIAMVKKGLNITPDDAWAHSFLGDLYMKIDNKEMALKEYDKALRIGTRNFR